MKHFIIGTYCSLLILNKLVIQKRFSEVAEIFEKQLVEFEMSNTLAFSKNTPVTFRQAVPNDQLELYVEAICNLVIFYLTIFEVKDMQ